MQGTCAALSVEWQPKPAITLWDLGREGSRRVDTVVGDGARGGQHARAALADFETMQVLITTQDHRLELWDLRKLGAAAATSEPGVVADPSGTLNARQLGRSCGRALCSGRAGVVNIVDVRGAGGELPVVQTLYGHVSSLQWAAVDWDFAEKKENWSLGPLARAATLSADGQALFWDVLLQGTAGDDAGGPEPGEARPASGDASKEPSGLDADFGAPACPPTVSLARPATTLTETAPEVPAGSAAAVLAADGEARRRGSGSLELEAAATPQANTEGRGSIGSLGIPSASVSPRSPSASRRSLGSLGSQGVGLAGRSSVGGGSRPGTKRSSGASRGSMIRGSSATAVQDVSMKELPAGATASALSCVFEDATRQPCICAGSKDGSLRLFEWTTTMVDGRNELAEASPPLLGHSDQVTAVCADSGLGVVVSASLDRTLRVWGRSMESSGPDLVCQSICQGHTGSIRVLSADLHRGRAASGSMDETVRIWSLQANPVGFNSSAEPGECLGTLALPAGRGSPQELLACFASGQAAAVSRSGDLLLWDLERMQRVAHVGGHRGCVFAVQLKGPPGAAGRSPAWLPRPSRTEGPAADAFGTGSKSTASLRSAAADERDPNGLVAQRLPTAAWTRGPGWSRWPG